MRHLHVIGIGTGDPDHVSEQAVAAIAATDVFLVVDKGDGPRDLEVVRRQILDRHRPAGGYRWVAIPEVPRDRSPGDYRAEVRSWHQQRADRYEAALRDEVGDGETASVLVWGDPSLYDSTLRILDDVAARGTVPATRSVIPGVTSISALAAAHQIPLHRIGESVLITTGRRLLADGGWPDGIANAVVMLDGETAFHRLAARPGAEGLHIWWGAYVGGPHEVLIAGPLAEVADEIVRAREDAVARHGWVMDIYLLRRPEA